MYTSAKKKLDTFFSLLIAFIFIFGSIYCIVFRDIAKKEYRVERIPAPVSEYEVYEEEIEMETTAYCLCEECCGDWAEVGVNKAGERITASGHVVKQGDVFIAAPVEFEFGTSMKVDGYADNEWVEVKDRGGSEFTNGSFRIDLFFWKHSDALEYGRQKHVKVIILRKKVNNG